MHFLDQAKIYLKSGAGGPGAVAFRREKYIEYGGPNGGNGGKGGDVVMVAVPGLNTLIDFRYTQHFRAKRGGHGMGQNRTGASAPDLVIQVPVGTQVFVEEREELLADIPGLIEGAAEGAGIGDRFLGHIERCRVLIHLVDITGADPAEAMHVVERELEAYGEELTGKPRLIALNKIDLADAELAAGFAEELKAAGAERVFPISGATGAGIPALLDAVLEHLPAHTVTENPGTAEQEDEPDGEWSPLG